MTTTTLYRKLLPSSATPATCSTKYPNASSSPTESEDSEDPEGSSNFKRKIKRKELRMFQQLTGINVIMFYAPLLFKTLGFKTDAALYSTVIIGAVNALSTLVSVYAVDRAGRRMLLLEAGVYMFLSQAAFAAVFRIKVTGDADGIDRAWALMVVAVACAFVSSIAWSWGPICWLVPSETFPLEARAAGPSVSVCANLLLTFVMAQAFLSILCRLKHDIFTFFAGWVVAMSLFVLFFLPETKNVPIEEMAERVWRKHWFWKRFMDDDRNHLVANLNRAANN